MVIFDNLQRKRGNNLKPFFKNNKTKEIKILLFKIVQTYSMAQM